MNHLSELQVLMFLFVLLIFVSFLWNPLLTPLAIVALALQAYISVSLLPRDYPEDWKRYTLLFLLLEAVILLIFYFILTLPISTIYTSPFTVLWFFLGSMFLVLLMRLFLFRRYCFGTVLFSTRGWAGVYVKSDLFSRVQEANYAVKNNLAVKKGDRVRIRVELSGTHSIPSRIEKILKK